MKNNTQKKSEKDWKNLLSPESYRILRLKGTEAPFSGKFWDHSEQGVYKCAGCGSVLFHSNTKFKSGCGWPSFTEAKSNDRIIQQVDRSHGMVRTEVLCKTCGGHLGHVFDDGPPPTGKRYCINSAALKFVREREREKKK